MQPSRVSFCTYYSLKCLFIIFIIYYKDPKTKTGSFSFKKLSDFPPFLTIRWRLQTAPTGPGSSEFS